MIDSMITWVNIPAPWIPYSFLGGIFMNRKQQGDSRGSREPWRNVKYWIHITACLIFGDKDQGQLAQNNRGRRSRQPIHMTHHTKAELCLLLNTKADDYRHLPEYPLGKPPNRATAESEGEYFGPMIKLNRFVSTVTGCRWIPKPMKNEGFKP